MGNLDLSDLIEKHLGPNGHRQDTETAPSASETEKPADSPPSQENAATEADFLDIDKWLEELKEKKRNGPGRGKPGPSREKQQTPVRGSGSSASEDTEQRKITQDSNVIPFQGDNKREQKALWKRRIARLASELIKADPEYHKPHLTVEMIRDSLQQEVFASVRSSLFDTQFAVYKPPEWMDDDETWALIGNACEIAWEAWRTRDRNDLIVSQQAVSQPEPPAEENPLPQVFIRNKIEILTLDQLRERRQSHVRKWVVEPWLARGELSTWSGKVEHGKTTTLRELVLCVLRGEPFLGRRAERGRVFYAMLDADGEDLTSDEFEMMGLGDEDASNIQFMFEPMLATMANGPEQFFKALWEWRPDLVIIDPMARLKQIQDFNDYSNTYLMAMLSQYAKQLDAHFALPMHIPRGRPPGASVATAAFGSIIWGASVNARFVIERKEPSNVHVIRTSKGKSAGFEGLEGEHVLERDEHTHRISLGKPLSFGERARTLKFAVWDFMRGASYQEFTADGLARELNEMRAVVQAAANMLVEDQEKYDKGGEHGRPTGVKRSGKGKRNSPYVYHYEPQNEGSVRQAEDGDAVSDVQNELKF